MYNFDELIDRKSTPAAKFHSIYLQEIFGTDQLYPFWVADMDFKIPPSIQEAFYHRTDHGVFGYELKSNGCIPAISLWFNDRFHCTLNSDWILFTPTIMSSVALAIDAFTSPTDGIIILPPVYMDFANTIHKTGRRIVEVPLELINLHYEIDFECLERMASIPENTVLLISNPHNPGGRVWTRTELEKIVDICLKHHILLISDEIHADIIFSMGKFTSLLDFPDIHSQLVVCYSPGKVFNIAAVTDSLAIIPEEKKRIEFRTLLQRYNMGRTNAFAQVAMESGFKHSSPWVDALVKYVEKNHDFIAHFLETRMPQIKLVKQEGTFLVWFKVDQLPLQGNDLIRYLAKEARVGLNDGAAFGKAGEGFLRMNIACPLSIIKEAMEGMAQAIGKLNLKK
jgi:cystathionine beta-lyase